MSAINRQPKKISGINSMLIVGGVIATVSVLLLAYLMWHVTPEKNIERVEIVAVTESECIAEIFDGFAVNIRSCQAQTGEYIVIPVDQKTKERAAAMNPTR
ncbi:MAG: hypothetical protein ACRBB5_05870 [Nitrosopumilus sp.]